ncbi:hypothetical protein [Streptomyces sp. NPDC057545]|uniref:hypothetical protein n=1 Tax=Streptomyces sp. NPDC057545 TaxID=3346164 RepID=UPI003695A1B5
MSSTTLPDKHVTRELVLPGESGRRGGRTVIAESRVEIAVSSDEALDRCIAALRASDERLAAQPDRKYDWQSTWLERHATKPGGTVAFGVAWYDEAFFDEKKNTYMKPDHLAMYAHIGAGDGDVSVTHWRRVS